LPIKKYVLSDVRNIKSTAHDNPILDYEESLLIFNEIRQWDGQSGKYNKLSTEDKSE
jgi:hypothetical protein